MDFDGINRIKSGGGSKMTIYEEDDSIEETAMKEDL